ncbi:hypothetical protein J7337_012455 [Fusarium musae]|uniref:Uncharacterized protein n=1 Tax=Fusarium musae TaxID=1042133 RepID=A0A9P8IJ83_9HYPO|nr:hypothetical protein J7337_012455 [Fusarium musae]KAG9495892.1 hypothetical protein J7337_012455 [Fusarium musae]
MSDDYHPDHSDHSDHNQLVNQGGNGGFGLTAAPSQSQQSSMSSTGASSDAGDSVHLRMPDENAKRVAQAYQTLIKGGEIYKTVARLHGVFVQLNSKKLYVMRTTTSAKDAQTFAQYVIKQIEDRQSDPAGQEDTDLVERQDVILTNMKLLTPDLATDLYIMLNKAKKASDLKDQPDTTNRKATGKKKAKVTQDRSSAVLTGDGGNHESDDGTENRNLESTRTTAGGPSRQVSFSSEASGPPKRSLRSRQISGSSGVGADAAASSQHSQASATTIQRRRSKQKTRFALSDNDEIPKTRFRRGSEWQEGKEGRKGDVTGDGPYVCQKHHMFVGG